MNPALMASQIAVAAAVAQRQALLKRLQALPPGEATRKRLLAGKPELETTLEQMLEQRIVRENPDGTLRHDPDVRRAAASSGGKPVLVVMAVLALLGITVAATLLALAP